MERGFSAERGYGGVVAPLFWVAGAMDWSFWGGLKWRGRRRLYVSTMRCVGCGYLEFYAPNPR